MYIDRLKRTLRDLKKLEQAIRSDGRQPGRAALVWDRYFTTRDVPKKTVHFPLSLLLAMDRDTLKAVFSDYFLEVYIQYYRESGQNGVRYFDPASLEQLGLPADAESADIKKRFRRLAKEYHPDMGGESAKFIRLMDVYRKLMEEHK